MVKAGGRPQKVRTGSFAAMRRVIVRQVNCEALMNTIKLKRKMNKASGWFSWSPFLWFVSFGEAKEMNEDVARASWVF